MKSLNNDFYKKLDPKIKENFNFFKTDIFTLRPENILPQNCFYLCNDCDFYFNDLERLDEKDYEHLNLNTVKTSKIVYIDVDSLNIYSTDIYEIKFMKTFSKTSFEIDEKSKNLVVAVKSEIGNFAKAILVYFANPNVVYMDKRFLKWENVKEKIIEVLNKNLIKIERYQGDYTITIGADPEAELLRNGEIVDADGFLTDPINIKNFGLDGNSSIVELRPEASLTIDSLINKIREIIKYDMNEEIETREKGDVFGLCVTSERNPTGFHIHISIPSIFLDYFKRTINSIYRYAKQPEKRKNGIYSKPNSYEEKAYGFEYRSLPSTIMVHPEILKSFLTVLMYNVNRRFKKIFGFETNFKNITKRQKDDALKIIKKFAYIDFDKISDLNKDIVKYWTKDYKPLTPDRFQKVMDLYLKFIRTNSYVEIISHDFDKTIVNILYRKFMQFEDKLGKAFSETLYIYGNIGDKYEYERSIKVLDENGFLREESSYSRDYIYNNVMIPSLLTEGRGAIRFWTTNAHNFVKELVIGK